MLSQIRKTEFTMNEELSPLMALIRQERPKNELAVQNWADSLRLSYLALPVKRIDDVIALENPTPLVKISKAFGEDHTLAALVIVVNDLVDFFNVPNSMGQEQIAYTVRMIRDEYYYFTIEDFKVCFDNAKKGRYGKLYGGIDGSVIMGWLAQYAEERMQAFAEHNDRKAYSDKERYERRGDIQKVAEMELRQILGRNYKSSI